MFAGCVGRELQSVSARPKSRHVDPHSAASDVVRPLGDFLPLNAQACRRIAEAKSLGGATQPAYPDLFNRQRELHRLAARSQPVRLPVHAEIARGWNDVTRQ